MIAEVDTALEALVRRDAVNGTRVDILFDAPTKDWVARRNAPTIDLYLYDIREDLPRRQLAMEPVRDVNTGYVSERRLPPRRFRLSYLITAWTQRPEDEHRLLSACLVALARNEFIPFDLVEGSLATSPFPVLLSVGMPPPQDRSIADVWSALGGELKPSLDLVATAPLDLSSTQPVGAPVLEAPVLGIGGPEIGAEYPRRGSRSGGIRRGRGAVGAPIAQTELVRGSDIGAPKFSTVGTGATASESGRGGKRGSTKASTGSTADDEPPDAEESPLAGLGSGRIVRIRGLRRP